MSLPIGDSFDFRRVELRGRHRVEASAGTGKTWNLTALYLRLVVERRLEVEQILVVTFTEAATRELKCRLRSVLAAGLAVLRGVRPPTGPLDDWLPGLTPDEARAAELSLRLALRSMDRAAISTIHGFCSRILRDHAFASGLRFDTRVEVDDSALRQELIDDFWRRTSAELSPVLAAYLPGRLDPELLRQLLDPLMQHPDSRLITRPSGGNLESLAAECRTKREQLARTWQKEAGCLENLCLDPSRLNWGRRDRRKVWQDLCTFIAEDEIVDLDLSPLECLMASRLEGKWKRGVEPLCLDFPVLLEEFAARHAALLDELEAQRQQLIRAALEELRRELPRRKDRLGEIGFQDMLLRLRDALRGPAGNELVTRLRGQYQAALIDEFQDTDSVQWEIFSRLFPPDTASPLFLIGDPKQAIYAFRGGDIHTYFAAGGPDMQEHSLACNFRSTAALVGAVNELFHSHPCPFVFPQIRFHAVAAADQTAGLQEPVFAESSPLILVWHDEGRQAGKKGWKPMSVGTVRSWISHAAAGEIVRLLGLARKGEARLGTEVLRARDLAVLVQTNRQAEEMRRILAKRGVPAAIRQSGNVFLCDEANDWRILLTALLCPGDIGALKALLTTVFFQRRAEEIHRLDGDPTELAAYLSRQQGWRRAWERQGVITLLRLLMEEEDFPARLVARPGGERRLTNLFQIAELLQEAEYRQNPGNAGLLRWLESRMFPARMQTVPDSHLLRLASDEDTVSIVTMHASKGLEYPVVFCLSPWEGESAGASGLRQSGPVFCQDPREGGRVLDLGGARYDEHRRQMVHEQLAERLRLLYVALTRGTSRVYLFGAPANLSQPGGLDYLLFNRQGGGTDGDGYRLSGSLEPGLLEHELRQRVGKVPGMTLCLALPPGGSRLEPLPAPADGQGPRAADCRRRVTEGWWIQSFTSLARHDDTLAEWREREDETPGEEILPAAPLLAAWDEFLPRGNLGGNLFHALMEEMNFATVDPAADCELAHRLLRRHGLSGERAAPLAALARLVLRTPLGEDGFRLNMLAARDRLTELEFYFPLRPERAASLPPVFAGLSREKLQGYLKGFIDLIFRYQGRYHLLDWKTNRLGDQPDAYAPSALDEAMRRNDYDLQQTIYQLALHRYLRLRLPDYDPVRHLGGSWYLFVRGFADDSAPGRGVCRRPPDLAALAALDCWLEGK